MEKLYIILEVNSFFCPLIFLKDKAIHFIKENIVQYIWMSFTFSL